MLLRSTETQLLLLDLVHTPFTSGGGILPGRLPGSLASLLCLALGKAGAQALEVEPLVGILPGLSSGSRISLPLAACLGGRRAPKLSKWKPVLVGILPGRFLFFYLHFPFTITNAD